MTRSQLKEKGQKLSETKGKRKPRTITLLDVSDLHCGSTTAICPPRIPLDDGGEYVASKLQLWTWQCWLDLVARTAAARKQSDSELYILLNGDLVDGDHHHTSQIISQNPTIQNAVIAAALKPLIALSPDRIITIRGTEIHTGNSASSEEGIAKGLARDGHPIVSDPDTGAFSWWHFRAELNGMLLDATHHGRTGQREHTRAGAASLHAHDIFMSHAKANQRAPDLCLRAHYHRFNDSYDACPTRVVTSGAFQHKTGYVHKKHADSQADIGGVLVTIPPEGKKYAVEKILYECERGAVWHPS